MGSEDYAWEVRWRMGSDGVLRQVIVGYGSEGCA